LKKVSIAENHIGGLNTASENKPPPTTLQKTGGRNSVALTFSVGLHVLIAVVLGIIVIKDQIATGTEEFAGHLLPQDPPQTKRVIATNRPKVTFEARDNVVETPIKRTVVTNAKIPNTLRGPTLPTAPTTDLDPVGPSLNEAPRLSSFTGRLSRPVQPIQTNVKPKLDRPTSQGGPIIELDIPDSGDGPALKVPDIITETQQGMELPRRKREVKPIYPTTARRAQKEGKVLLQATIGIDGIPKDIVALTKLGFGFEQAAIDALKKTRYFPAKKNGEEVEGRFNIPFEFKLED
jgi:TonB family protein